MSSAITAQEKQRRPESRCSEGRASAAGVTRHKNRFFRTLSLAAKNGYPQESRPATRPPEANSLTKNMFTRAALYGRPVGRPYAGGHGGTAPTTCVSPAPVPMPFVRHRCNGILKTKNPQTEDTHLSCRTPIRHPFLFGGTGPPSVAGLLRRTGLHTTGVLFLNSWTFDLGPWTSLL